ncbi:MAG: UDP-N-acetylmuramoyl-L-alanine--D-glutamate ligase, partial [Clostridia bacterium]|nr:UDP-N-acetylmuramoyl-L-alanine--D-glutamate ligase [Clostridia bacterium]
TNADATLKAVDSMKKPTVLILGGKDKGLPFDGLFERLKNSEVKHVVLTGESRYTLLESAKKAQFNCVSVTEDFEIAFKIAKITAKDGDCVLLSPACSSFDAFSDYEERGDKFISLVEGIDDGNKS